MGWGGFLVGGLVGWGGVCEGVEGRRGGGLWEEVLGGGDGVGWDFLRRDVMEGLVKGWD